MADERRIVIIGAGITGLSCAYYLQQWGLAPLVLEASNHAGGVISTTRKNGFLFESGPQGPRFSERLRTSIAELDLDSEFVRGDPRAKRYILKDGQLQTAPLSPSSLLSTRVIGFKSKFRIRSEPFGFSHPPASEETIASFVDRKFGQETLDYLVDPIVSAVFFGDVRRMGMGSASPALVRWEQQHGSVARSRPARPRRKCRAQQNPKFKHRIRPGRRCA